MNRTLIVCGGQFHNISKSALQEYDFIIACDKGYEYCEKLHIIPDLFIGDCDSLKKNLPDNIKKIILPHLKDDTDTMYAIKEALKTNCTSITLCCALGNRVDHTIANIQSLNFIAEHECSAKMFSEDEELFCIKNNSIKIPIKTGFSLSVFSLTEKSEGVYEKGTLYELENAVLTNTFPLGISNEWKDDIAEIGVKNGTLLIITSRIND